jgi:hypothetical protein
VLDFDPVLLAVFTLATEGRLSFSSKYASAGDSLVFVFPVAAVPGRKPWENWEPCDMLSLESL